MSDRRQFLKETAVGLAATAALGNLEPPAANAKKQAFETPRASGRRAARNSRLRPAERRGGRHGPLSRQ